MRAAFFHCWLKLDEFVGRSDSEGAVTDASSALSSSSLDSSLSDVGISETVSPDRVESALGAMEDEAVDGTRELVEDEVDVSANSCATVVVWVRVCFLRVDNVATRSDDAAGPRRDLFDLAGSTFSVLRLRDCGPAMMTIRIDLQQYMQSYKGTSNRRCEPNQARRLFGLTEASTLNRDQSEASQTPYVQTPAPDAVMEVDGCADACCQEMKMKGRGWLVRNHPPAWQPLGHNQAPTIAPVSPRSHLRHRIAACKNAIAISHEQWQLSKYGHLTLCSESFAFAGLCPRSLICRAFYIIHT